MDFLDPKKKRSTAIKLAVGHFLMLLLVVVGTFILLLQAYGFDVDRKTGEVIQNGLVFVDSAPDGAEIKLNGTVQSEQTNTRLALPEGKYEIEINKQNYRTWKKSFDLKGGFIERFNYPTLLLNELAPVGLQAFEVPVNFTSQSPDRRWLLIGQKNNLNNLNEYDLNTLESERPVSRTLALPGNIFTPAAGEHSLKLVEWSTDNKHLLIQHSWANGSEFVIINRDLPANSFNMNTRLSQNPSSVKLRDKKTDDIYMHDAQARTLSRVNIESGQFTLIANNVLAYEPNGEDLILMAVASESDPSKTQIIVWDGSNNLLIREVAANPNIRLGVTKYDGALYAAIHDPSENKTYIYKNPVDVLRRQAGLKPVPIMILRSAGPVNDLSFSDNSQFIAVRSGQNFSVYDNEYQRTYRFDIPLPFDNISEITWMDGHRFIESSGGKILIFEFDGQNQQVLVDANPSVRPVFNRDYTAFYSLGASSDGKPALHQTQLRLKEDR